MLRMFDINDVLPQDKFIARKIKTLIPSLLQRLADYKQAVLTETQFMNKEDKTNLLRELDSYKINIEACNKFAGEERIQKIFTFLQAPVGVDIDPYASFLGSKNAKDQLIIKFFDHFQIGHLLQNECNSLQKKAFQPFNEIRLQAAKNVYALLSGRDDRQKISIICI
jgi:hypothetical protein